MSSVDESYEKYMKQRAELAAKKKALKERKKELAKLKTELKKLNDA